MLQASLVFTNDTWNYVRPTLFSYDEQVYTLKLSLKSDSKSTTKEETVSDTTSRVVEPEVETSQGGKIREIVMDSADSDLVMSCFRFRIFSTVRLLALLFSTGVSQIHFLLCVL
jgi:hypothetical protein